MEDSDLAAYWRLNEDSGTLANDSSGNGNTGTISNGAWLYQGGAGKVNPCLSFNGSNSSVVVTDAGELPAAYDVQTISCWMYVSATPSAASTAVAVSGNDSGVYLGYSSSTTFGVWRYNGTLLVSTTTLPTPGAWHFISYTLNNGTHTLYIDGNAVSSSSATTDSGDATTLTAGMSPGGANYFTGDLAEIRVYSRALNPAEISGLAAGEQ